MKIKNIREIELHQKTVILRLDLNVPIQKGEITDNSRIVKALPTIKHLLKEEAKIIIISHLGRPKKSDDGTYPEKFSLQLVAEELKQLLGQGIIFLKDLDENTIKSIKQGEAKDIFLLENIRFHPEETSKEEEVKKKLAQELAGLGEIFINDAFGAVHRDHASTTTLAKLLPSAIGFLIEKEIAFLSKCLDAPERPFVVILGGAKISDKILLIKNLLQKVDKILIGGGMSYTFLKSQGYEVGKSLVDDSLIPTCQEILEKHREKIILPEDFTITDIDFSTFTLKKDLTIVELGKIRAEDESFDIGPKTIEKFQGYLEEAQTIFWNGPMGVFECDATAKGTWGVAKIIAGKKNQGGTTIIGGGDSVSALKKLHLLEEVSFASSGGGASLEFLEGKELPGLKVIQEKN